MYARAKQKGQKPIWMALSAAVHHGAPYKNLWKASYFHNIRTAATL
jgi:hypothetical protein